MQDRCEVSNEQKKEVMITLPQSVMETLYGAPQRIYHYSVISGLHENIIISETTHDRGDITIEHK
jgi:hypothetical protein